MDSVELFLLTIAAIFIIGVAGEVFFARSGVPDVVWLLLTGIVIGPIAGLVTRPQLLDIAPYFAALTLVVVLFEGGSRLRLRDLSRAAPRSSALALTSFTTATVVVTLASMIARAVGTLPGSWTWSHGIMLGAILGGSSSIIIMPAMTHARVNDRIANLVSLESAFTDALCVVGAAAMLSYLEAGPGNGGSPAMEVTGAFAIGGLVGVGAGLFWILVLRRLGSSVHTYPITLAALLGLYVLIQQAGGSAALCILAFAVLVGNAGVGGGIDATTRPGLDAGVRGVHGQIAFMVKSFFFTFIGAMLGPPWSAVALGVILGGVLFAIRWPAVRLATAGSSFSTLDRAVIWVAFPRGLAAGVLATLPAAAGIAGTEHLSTVVFATVVTTVIVFAAGLPLSHRRNGSAPPEVEAEAEAEADPSTHPV